MTAGGCDGRMCWVEAHAVGANRLPPWLRPAHPGDSGNFQPNSWCLDPVGQNSGRVESSTPHHTEHLLEITRSDRPGPWMQRCECWWRRSVMKSGAESHDKSGSPPTSGQTRRPSTRAHSITPCRQAEFLEAAERAVLDGADYFAKLVAGIGSEEWPGPCPGRE